MRIKFSKYAKLELEDAVSFYELQQPGLGRRFKNEVKKALLRIAEHLKPGQHCYQFRAWKLSKLSV